MEINPQLFIHKSFSHEAAAGEKETGRVDRLALGSPAPTFCRLDVSHRDGRLAFRYQMSRASQHRVSEREKGEKIMAHGIPVGGATIPLACLRRVKE